MSSGIAALSTDEDKQSVAEKLLEQQEEQQERFLEEHRLAIAEDSAIDDALAALGAKEEESLVPPDVDTEDLTKYAEKKSGAIPEVGLTSDEERAINDYMKNLKEKIEARDADSLRMLFASQTYQERDAIESIYKSMYGKSIEQALQEKGLTKAELYPPMKETQKNVYGLQQKVLDACYGLAA